MKTYVAKDMTTEIIIRGFTIIDMIVVAFVRLLILYDGWSKLILPTKSLIVSILTLTYNIINFND
jgi:hypothetical protein